MKWNGGRAVREVTFHQCIHVEWIHRVDVYNTRLFSNCLSMLSIISFVHCYKDLAEMARLLATRTSKCPGRWRNTPINWRSRVKSFCLPVTALLKCPWARHWIPTPGYRRAPLQGSVKNLTNIMVTVCLSFWADSWVPSAAPVSAMSACMWAIFHPVLDWRVGNGDHSSVQHFPGYLVGSAAHQYNIQLWELDAENPDYCWEGL